MNDYVLICLAEVKTCKINMILAYCPNACSQILVQALLSGEATMRDDPCLSLAVLSDKNVTLAMHYQTWGSSI